MDPLGRSPSHCDRGWFGRPCHRRAPDAYVIKFGTARLGDSQPASARFSRTFEVQRAGLGGIEAGRGGNLGASIKTTTSIMPSSRQRRFAMHCLFDDR